VYGFFAACDEARQIRGMLLNGKPIFDADLVRRRALRKLELGQYKAKLKARLTLLQHSTTARCATPSTK
jgi:hypothetical protein